MASLRSRVGVGVLALAATTAATLTSPPALADDAIASLLSVDGDQGRGSVSARTETSERSAARTATAAMASDAEVGGTLDMPTSYPYQPSLKVFPDNPNDAADRAELIGHDDIAPFLQDLMRASNRVSTQVIGQSTEGRDLYLVTVTAPETEAQTAAQTRWREMIKEDPAAAASDEALKAGYKTPVWISNNIHGNEWEGTDAALNYIEDLAKAPWTQVSSLLRDHRLYFSVSLNPDGRTLATRATRLGFDPNRDMITGATPESRSYVQTARTIQPLYAADYHGYTNVLQFEPCGPPHGENYEYDLAIGHNYALALKVEKDVTDANIAGNTYYDTTTGRVVSNNTGRIKIPYRDTPSGWDDYPPIFTAQYAAYHGAVAATVELPLTRGGTGGTQTPPRARINTEVAEVSMASLVEYVAGNSDDMLANQIEMFRRGVAGEPKVSLTTENVADVPGPAEWKPLWDVADDQDQVDLPRAYVIPVGDDQRSASDAADVVDKLLSNGIEVGTLDSSVTVGETTYPAGSYVVDMHQPLKGLANTLLDLGSDISQKVPSMYDISAWSYAYLWGATVDKVGSIGDAAIGATTAVRAAAGPGALPAEGSYLTFDLAGVGDYAALNSLLADDVTVSALPDGSAITAPGDYDAVEAASKEFGIDVEAATADDIAALADAKGLDAIKIAYVGNQDDLVSLTELGFEGLVPVSAALLSATPTLLDDVDVIWVAGNLTFNASQAPGRAALDAFLARGGSLVGRGAAANTAANTYGLLSARAVAGNTSGNGIVAVDTPDDSLLAPYEQDYAFVYPAVSFADLGAGVKVEQTFGTGNPLLAGHWRSTNATNGPEVAAGQPSVISAETEAGSKAVVFGTSPLYRTHPKGGLSQVARALVWAAPEADEKVEAPSATTTTLTGPAATLTYPASAAFDVSVEGAASGTVELVDATSEAVLGRAAVAEGAARIVLSRPVPGTRSVRAVFTPSDATAVGSVSDAVRYAVRRATPTLGLGIKREGNGVFTVSARATTPGLRTSLILEVTDKHQVVKRFRVTTGETTRVRMRFAAGTHQVRVVHRTTPYVSAAASRTITFRG